MQLFVTLNNGEAAQRFQLATGQCYRLQVTSDAASALDGDWLVLAPFGGAVLIVAAVSTD